MTAWALICSIKIGVIIVLLVHCEIGSGRSQSETTQCEYYNETLCLEFGQGCNTTQDCDDLEPGKRNHCYVLWQNNTVGFTIKMKGCWLNHHECYDQQSCVEKREEPKKELMFCCCEGNMCNKYMYHIPIATTSTPLSAAKPIKAITSSSRQVFYIFMYTLVPFLGLSVVVAITYWIYRRRKMAYFNEVPTTEPSPLPPPSPHMGLRSIQLIEIKARGRFGAVWKATMMNESVAVKVFPIQDRHSWLVEQEIFRLPQMKHPNVLAFIGAEKRGDNLQAEYWLITAFHERGSLSDFLKANLISWTELCHIAETMAKGLMHLHEELPPSKGEPYKPALAHRDFKSKNVLLKTDLSACIADFGLALLFHPGQSPGDSHGQVGTRRYMAPEVLEGAINFQHDSFLRIDMYACGLVLWELLSRCKLQDGPVDEYLLPFEEEVGQHPTLEEMQNAVVQKKIRPKLKDYWKTNQNLQLLCETIEECWDHDAEARLSASCIQERISVLKKVSVQQGNHCYSTTTSLTTKLPMVTVTPSIQPPPKESSI